jgi:ketosteroid isomerase-like protein
MSALAQNLVLALACLGALLAGCAATTGRSGSSAADLAAISRFNEQYLRAINAGDAAALSRLTDEEHIMIAPNRPIIDGKAANDAANAGAFARFTIEEAWTPLETVVAGDLAYQRGTFTVVATPRAGGDARSTHGNFLRIYRRQRDGSWRMTRDMFSSDRAATP